MYTGIEQITYDSVLKLMHERTKFRLHSHDMSYGSGSGQQSVTGFPNVDDANSYWVRYSLQFVQFTYHAFRLHW